MADVSTPCSPSTSTAVMQKELGPAQPPLSKNAQKKAAKKAERDALKPIKRMEERRRRKERKKEQKAAGTLIPKPRRPDATPWNGLFVLDCAFDGKMTEKEIVSLSSQVRSCYSAHRQATTQPLPVLCTSFGGQLERRIDAVLDDRQSWAKSLRFSSDGLESLWAADDTSSPSYARDDVVYLTADSPNVLTTLEEGKAYVLGNLVDHNRYKNLCYDRARALGVQHAQLPIGQFFDRLQGRKVITVNQVFELMLHYLANRDWAAAFEAVIPKRKIIATKEEEPCTMHSSDQVKD